MFRGNLSDEMAEKSAKGRRKSFTLGNSSTAVSTPRSKSLQIFVARLENRSLPWRRVVSAEAKEIFCFVCSFACLIDPNEFGSSNHDARPTIEYNNSRLYSLLAAHSTGKHFALQ
jgi:hypothetical protein